MQTHVRVNPEEFQKFRATADKRPVFMLNLLKYKQRVAETGQSGEVAYREYLKAATPFFEKVSAEVVFFGNPQHMLIGPLEEKLWDAVILVKYDSFTDFMAMATAEGYPSHLREMALADSRLIHCKPNG